MVGEDEGLFNLEEADVLMVSLMVDAVRDGKKVIRILSDDTDVFIILMFWAGKLSIKAMETEYQYWLRWRIGLKLCCTSITACLLSGIDASSFLECTPLLVVIRHMHEFSRARQPLHCDVIVGKQIILN